MPQQDIAITGPYFAIRCDDELLLVHPADMPALHLTVRHALPLASRLPIAIHVIDHLGQTFAYQARWIDNDPDHWHLTLYQTAQPSNQISLLTGPDLLDEPNTGDNLPDQLLALCRLLDEVA